MRQLSKKLLLRTRKGGTEAITTLGGLEKTNPTLLKAEKVLSLMSISLKKVLALINSKLKPIFIQTKTYMNKSQAMRRQVLVPFSIGLLLILIPIIYLISQHAKDVEAWYDDNWTYRVQYTINNPDVEVLNNKILIEVDTAALIAVGKIQEDCGDSGFVTMNGEILKYYIDSAGGECNTLATHYYVLIPIIYSGETSIYHYYGNRLAADGTQLQQFTEDTFTPASISSKSEEVGPGPIAYWKMDEGYGEGQGAFVEQQINIMTKSYTDSWHDSGWSTRKHISLKNLEASAITDYQLKLTVAHETDMQADFDDLRFTNTAGIVLGHWIENKTDGLVATVWVRVDQIITGSNTTIYMYYGNPSATSASNGAATFLFFDDFVGSEIDTAKWTITDATGWSVTNSELKGTSTTGRLTSISTFDAGVIQEVKHRYVTLPAGGYMVAGFWLATDNGFGYRIGATDQYRNNAGWANIGAAPPSGTDLFTQIISRAALVDLYVKNFNDMSTYKSYLNLANAVSAEPIVIGYKYDNTNAGQTYEGYWDQIRVRKYTAVEPLIYFALAAEPFNTTSGYPVDNSLGIISFDGSKYTNARIVLEAIVSTDGSNWITAETEDLDLSTTLQNYTVRISAGNGAVAPRIYLVNLTENTTVGSAAFGTASDKTVYIKSARLKILQRDSTAITNSQTQIEVGNSEVNTVTSLTYPYSPLTDKKVYLHNSTEYNPNPTTNFETTMKAIPTEQVIEQQIELTTMSFQTLYHDWEMAWSPTDNSLGQYTWDETKYPGAQVYLEIIAKGENGNNVTYVSLFDTEGNRVTSSTVNPVTHVSYNRSRSGLITLTHGKTYTVRVAASGYSIFKPPPVYLRSARLIVVQRNYTGITNTQTNVELANALRHTSSTMSEVQDKKLYYYDASKFAPAPTTYFETIIRNAQPTIEQQINFMSTQGIVTRSTTYVPTDNSLGIIQWDANKYSNAEVFFEVVVMSSSQGFYNRNVFGGLLTTSGTIVAQIEYGPDAIGDEWKYKVIRTGPITLEHGEFYTAKTRSRWDGDVGMKAARLIIIQKDQNKLTSTETNVDIGSISKKVTDTYQQIDDKKVYYYDASKFSPAPTATFETNIRNPKPTIEQEINILNKEFYYNSTTYGPKDSSLGIFKWEASKYPGATVHFEAMMRGNTAYAALHRKSDGAILNTSIVSTASGTYTLVRSGEITLEDNTEYTVQIRSSGTNLPYIKAARIKIVQTDGTKITDTRTTAEMGNWEKQTSTNATQLTDKKIYYYNSSRFSPAPTTYFEAAVRSSQPTIEQQINITNRPYSVYGNTFGPTDNSLGIIKWEASKYSGAKVYFEAICRTESIGYGSDNCQVQLYTTGSPGSGVTGGAITRVSTSFGVARSGEITSNLVDGTEYTVRVRDSTASRTSTMQAARLIIIQTDPVKLTETQVTVDVGASEAKTTSSPAQLNDKKIYYYDSSRFSPTPTTYFEASLRNAQPTIEQHLNILTKSVSVYGNVFGPTDNSAGIIKWEASKYPGAKVYFEASCITESIGYGSDNCQVQLYTTGSPASGVTGSTVTRVSTSFGRVRSGEITSNLVDGTEYTVRVRDSTASRTSTVRSARLVIIQTDPTKITDTQTNVEITNGESTTMTSYTQISNKKIFQYVSSRYSPAPTIYYEAAIVNDTAGETTYAALFENGSSCTTQIAGTEASVTGTTWGLVRLGPISLTNNTEYMVCMKATGGSASIANAKVILAQSEANGITALETYQQQITTLATNNNNTPTARGFSTLYNPDLDTNQRSYAGGTINYNFEVTMKTNAGSTGFTRLNYASTASTLSTESSDYVRLRTSSNITNDFPQFPQIAGAFEVDTQIYNSVTGLTSLSSSWLAVQITDLATNGVTTYADLYNLDDSQVVTGSEVSTTSTEWSLARTSSPITLTTNKQYVVRFWNSVSGNRVHLQNARIILNQSNVNGITTTEIIQHGINTVRTDTDDVYTDQGYNIYYNPTHSSEQDSFAGGTFNYVFEATMKASSGTTGYAMVRNMTTSADITDSVISTGSTGYARVRGNVFTTSLPDFPLATSYSLDTRVKNSENTGNVTTVASSWIVVQVTNLATYETTVTAELYNITDGQTVANSAISTTSSAWTLLRSPSLNLTTNKEYVVRLKSSNNNINVFIHSARVILDQSDVGGITALETYQQHINTLETHTNSTYTAKNTWSRYNPDFLPLTNVPMTFMGGTFNYFYEATMKTSLGGTGNAQLYNLTTATAVSDSTISTNSETYARVISGDISDGMPQFHQVASHLLDARISTGAVSGQSVSVASSRTVIRVTNLATTQITTYAELYNLTDGTAVAGSETSSTNPDWTLLKAASPVTLTTGKEYTIRVKSSHTGIAAYTNTARILLQQQDASGITDLETLQPYIKYTSKDSDAYTDQRVLQAFHPETRTAVRSFSGGTVNYFFEATMKATSGTAQTRLYAADYLKVIDNTELTTASNTYARVRSGNITNDMPLFPYWIREMDTQIRNVEAAGGETSVSSSWIVIQVSNLATSSITTYADLYNVTDSTPVPGSELFTTSTDWVKLRTPDIALETGKEYIVRMRTTHEGSASHMQNARIIIDQYDPVGISDLEVAHQQVNVKETQATSTYTSKFNPIVHTKTNFMTGTQKYYYEATMKTSGSTGYALLRNNATSTDITASEVTTTSSNYQRVRSADITANIPNASNEYSTRLKNEGTDTTSVSNSWLIIQVEDLGVVTAYAALFEDGPTCTNMVPNTEVSVTGRPGAYNYQRVRASTNIALTHNMQYMVCTTGQANTRVEFSNAKIIHTQARDMGITKLALYHTLTNTAVTDSDSGYTSQSYQYNFDPTHFNNILEAFYETTIKTPAGTGYSQLYNVTDAEPVETAEVTTTSTSYNRTRTEDIREFMPTSAATLDVQVKNSDINTTSVSNAWLIIRANGVAQAIINDSTANRHNGTLLGGDWRSGGECKSDGCIYWDGVTDRSEVTHSKKLNFVAESDFTISVWFKHALQDPYSPRTDTILAKYETTGADGGYKLYMNPDGTLTYGISDTNTVFPKDTVSSTDRYDDNRWHQVVVVKNGTSSLAMYVDLELVGFVDILTSGNVANNDSLWIAIDGDGISNPWKGYLDDVKIYPYARTHDEIKTDYYNYSTPTGSGVSFGRYDVSPLENGLLAYWKMDEKEAGTCQFGRDSCDSSGQNIHGIWENGVTSTQGRHGNAVLLGGNTDAIQVKANKDWHKDWEWYDSQWQNRIPVTVANSSNTNVKDYQVSVTVNYAAEMKSDFSDLRFVSASGALLNHWVETKTDGVTAKVWIKVDAIKQFGSTGIYMYYNNPSATSVSNGDSTFEFFDDATGTYSNKWMNQEGTGSYATVGGKRAINLNAAVTNIRTLNYQMSGAMAIDAELYATAVVTAVQYYQDTTPASNERYSARIDVRYGELEYIMKDSVTGTGSDVFSAAYTWVPTTLTRDQNANHTWIVNGQVAATRTNDTTYTSGYLALNHQNSGTGAAANVRVRKFVSPEPAPSVGTPETYQPVNGNKWQNRMKILIDNSEVTQNISNFPLMVKMNTTRINYGRTQNSGQDIRFLDTDNSTVLPHEIESWNESGDSFVWVKIPQIPTSPTEKYIWMYYNNPDAFDNQNPLDVWDSNYIGVWHLGETSGTPIYDSTSKLNHGAKTLETQPAATTSGKINGAQYYDGSNNAITIPINSTFNFGSIVTLEAWVNPPDLVTKRTIIGRENQTGVVQLEINNTTGSVGATINGTYIAETVTNVLTAGVYNHIAYTRSGTGAGTHKIYVNGVERTLVTNSATNFTNATGPFELGRRTAAGSQILTGSLDEVRMSNISRSGEWMLTQYKSMNDSLNNYVSENLILENQPSVEMTVAAWVNANTLDATTRAIISRGNIPSQDWYIQTDEINVGKLVFTADGGVNIGTSTTTLNTNEWYHIAMTAGSGKTTLYINGKIDKEIGFSGNIPATEDLAIGNSLAQNIGWNGIIDEVRILNRSFAAKEVFNLFKWASGPIAYWNFDEGVGTTAYDKSGNLRHGTLNRGPVWTNGKYGRAIAFDGDNDHVKVFHNTDFNLGDTSTLAISGWFNRSSFDTIDTIIAKKDDTSTSSIGYIVHIDDTTDKLIFKVSDGTAEYEMTSSTTFTSNGWNHFTVVWDPNVEQNTGLYINGLDDKPSSVGTISAVGTAVNTKDVIIGATSTITNNFHGSLDDIKIYNRTLSGANVMEELNAGHPLPGSPIGSQVAFWKMDEGYGNTAHDSSINRLDLTLSNTQWTNEGRFGKSLTFSESSSSYAYINDNSALSIVSDLTISAWLYPTNTIGTRTIAGKWDGVSDHSYLFVQEGGELIMYLNSASNYSATSAVNLQTGTWTYVAALYSASAGQLEFYVNGVIVASTVTGTIPTSINDNSSRFTIGATGTAGPSVTNHYEGQIDEIKIYNATLDPEQIKVDYNQGKAVAFGSTGTTPTGAPDNTSARAYCVPGDTTTCESPIAEWKLDENTGTYAYDTSGNGNTGTFGASPRWMSGKVGTGLYFDGIGDYVEAGDTPFDNTGDFTIEAWVKVETGATGSRQIVSKRPSFAGAGGYSLGIGNLGEIYCQTDNGTSLINSYTAYGALTSSSGWRHITAARSGSSCRVYIDGEDKTNTVGIHTTLALNNQNIRIGASTDNDEFWRGMIDEVRVFDYARTPAQVAWSYNKGGPVGWWKFDECQGPTAFDSSGRTKNGAIIAGPLGTHTAIGTCESSGTTRGGGAEGRLNASIYFDGNDDYIDIGDVASPVKTLSFWVYPGETDTGILQLSDIVTIGIGSEQIVYEGFDSPAVYVNGKPTLEITPSVWNHVVIFTDTAVSPSQMRIGRDPSTFFVGKIDDVRLYSYRLTEHQLRVLYNEGTVSF